MEKQGKESKSSIPLYGWIALIATVTGLWFVNKPLVPVGPGREVGAPPEHGRAPARLWQDPLQVVREATTTQASGAIPADLPEPFPLKPNDLVLPVAVPRGYNVELHEDRLRIRYAVLTALGIAGYAPFETQALPYLQIPGGLSETAGDPTGDERPLLVPYEWLYADKLRDADAKRYPRVLVVWLESETLAVDLAGRLRYLLVDALGWKQDGPAPLIRLIGPAWSDDLKTILDREKRPPLQEEMKAAFPQRDYGSAVKIYSPRATADDLILRLICEDCDFGDRTISDVDEPAHGLIVRTISSDRELAEALVEELYQRGVVSGEENPDDGKKIAILAEWDTSYGRGFPLTFAQSFQEALAGFENGQSNGEPAAALPGQAGFEWPDQLLQIVYMRGLEGNLPDNDGERSSVLRRENRSQDETEPPSDLDRAEGTKRLDYVRRLAGMLAPEGRNIKAIGVVGSDVYDKLLLLQALRPRFPHAVFFTTDLDARLLHRRVNEWARNLIVASSFDLQVSRELLHKVSRQRQYPPPFRDSYQTSIFLSTLLAVEEIGMDDVREAAQPEIYEIGRRRRIRLWPQDEVRWVHPLWIVLLVLGAGFLLLLKGLRAPAFWKEKQWLRCARCYAYFFIPVLILIVIVAFSVASDEYREPFTWVQGVSIWPTEVIRLLAATLAFHFLVQANLKIRKNNEQAPELFRESKRDLPHIEFKEPTPLSRDFWKDLAWFARSDWAAGPTDVPGLWARYQRWGLPRWRWARVTPVLVVYFLAAICLFWIFGFPEVPYRGESSQLADRIALSLSVGLQLALIFYVIDAIFLCRRFVEKLCDPAVRWPAKGTPPASDKDEDAGLSEVESKLELIAHRTEAVGRLIYYPFVILPVMILSRLSYFDRWDWPFSLIVVLGVNAVFAVIAAWLLRKSAEDARRRFITTLRLKRIELREQDREANREQLEDIERTMDDVSGERRGAFAPLTQNPVVGALLLPSGTVGLAFVLELLGASG